MTWVKQEKAGQVARMSEMRLVWIALLTGLVLLTACGCDWETAREAILAMSVNAASQSTEWTTEALPEASDTYPIGWNGGVGSPFAQMLRSQPWQAYLRQVQDYRDRLRNGSTGDQRVAHLDDLAHSADQLAAALGPSDRIRAWHELLVKSLTAGGSRASEREALERQSLERFVTAHLTAQQLRPEDLFALTAHSLAFPQCPTNGDLYVVMAERLEREGDLGAAVALLQQGKRVCRDSAEFKKVRTRFDQLFTEHAGEPGTPMLIVDTRRDGRSFDLADWQGHWVVVVFWASWSPECREEMPAIEAIRRRWDAKGVQFVGVSLDTNPYQLDAFLRQHPMPCPHLFHRGPARAAWDHPLAIRYRVQRLPSAFVVDPNGIVVAGRLHGAASLDAVIDQVLRPSPSAEMVAHDSSNRAILRGARPATGGR